MKSQKLCLLFIFITLPVVHPLHGQDSLRVGIKIGTGIVNSVKFSNLFFTSDPQHIIGSISLRAAPKLRLEFSTGFGFSRYTIDEDYDQSNPFAFGADRISKSSITGVPIELEAIFGTKISQQSPLRVFGGLGVGYYYYKSTIRTNVANLPKWDETKESLSGFAQYLTAGFGITIGSSLETVFQVKRIGFNFLKTKADLVDNEQRKVGERKSDVRTFSGLNELGVLFGLTFSL